MKFYSTSAQFRTHSWTIVPEVNSGTVSLSVVPEVNSGTVSLSVVPAVNSGTVSLSVAPEVISGTVSLGCVVSFTVSSELEVRPMPNEKKQLKL